MDLGVNTGNRLGKWTVELIERTFAMEAERHGERIRRVHLMLRAKGWPAGTAPYGFTTRGKKGSRKLVRDAHTRKIGAMIVKWRDGGNTWEEIYFHLLKHKARTRRGAEWSLTTIRRTYTKEKQLQATEKKLEAARPKA